MLKIVSNPHFFFSRQNSFRYPKIQKGVFSYKMTNTHDIYRKYKKKNFNSFFACVFVNGSDRSHPQLPEILQYRGHVWPGWRASAPNPRPRLKQFT